MRDFRKLEVWHKAHRLTLAVYKTTEAFPKSELYGLTSQLRRSAASIAANLAEGCGRQADGDFRRFVEISAGSATEVEYHLLLGHDLGYIPVERYSGLNTQVNEVKKMLAALSKRLRSTV